MGLVDAIDNVVPISPNSNTNCAPPSPTQTPPKNGSYYHQSNFQSNSNPPCYSNPSYGYPPAYAPNGTYGSYYNTGNNVNGSGIQKNGDIKIGNRSQRTGGVKIGSIGSNIGNQGGQQLVGDVKLANIG
uniref:Uncharacterized protein n=1 Tax=Chenopodium quinoa TaxID=63459 RepID=A0A803LPE6_CHEQI